MTNVIVLVAFFLLTQTTIDAGERDFVEIFKLIQNQLLNRTVPVCLPGFSAYEGSCYFLSPVKTNWIAASNSCALKRNSTLVAFMNTDELNFVVDKLLKPWKINQAFIGLVAREIGQWSWLDGRTFWNSIFGPLFYVYRPETSRCGLINLVNRTEIAIEGRDCQTDEAHFLCKYVQNHCHASDVCGRGGKCLNIGLTFRCQCNFFYQGKKCEKLSSKAVQSLIAVVIMGVMLVIGCVMKYDLYTYCRWKKNSTSIDDDEGRWTMKEKPLQSLLLRV